MWGVFRQWLTRRAVIEDTAQREADNDRLRMQTAVAAWARFKTDPQIGCIVTKVDGAGKVTTKEYQRKPPAQPLP